MVRVKGSGFNFGAHVLRMRVQIFFELGVCGQGFGFSSLGCVCGCFEMKGLQLQGFRLWVQGSGFSVDWFGFEAQGLGIKVQGSGFRV